MAERTLAWSGQVLRFGRSASRREFDFGPLVASTPVAATAALGAVFSVWFAAKALAALPWMFWVALMITCTLFTLWLIRPQNRTLGAASLLASTALMRPGILGETVGSFGFALLIPALLAMSGQERKGLSTQRLRVQVWLLATCVFWPMLIRGSVGTANLATMFLGPLIAFIGGASIGTRRDLTHAFVRLSSFAIFLQVASYLECALFTGFTSSTSFSFVEYGGRDWVYFVHSAGAVTTGAGGIFPWLGPRLTGWFGEPGIFGSFVAIVCMLDLAITKRARLSVHLVGISAIIFSQSIAALYIYVISIGVAALRLRRIPSIRWLALACVTVWLVFTYLGTTSLGAKALQNDSSVTDRLGGIYMGVGIQLQSTNSFEALGSSGINLLQSGWSFGAIYLIAGLAFYCVLPLTSPGSRATTGGVIALTLTILFSQPPLLPLWLLFAGILCGVQAAESHQLHQPDACGLAHQRSGRPLPGVSRSMT